MVSSRSGLLWWDAEVRLARCRRRDRRTTCAPTAGCAERSWRQQSAPAPSRPLAKEWGPAVHPQPQFESQWARRRTTRGPGNNDSSPRPKARRFSTFSFSAPRPAKFSAAQYSSFSLSLSNVIRAQSQSPLRRHHLKDPCNSHLTYTSTSINLIHRRHYLSSSYLSRLIHLVRRGNLLHPLLSSVFLSVLLWLS